MTKCPECGSTDIAHDAGPLPVCRSCDWTGWPTEQDWTDPDFVHGAVLAQIEDLSYDGKVLVLANVLRTLVDQKLEAE